jgi:hypothetical protein
MTKNAFSERQTQAFEEMAKQGILPEPVILMLERKAQGGPKSTWDKIKQRAVQGLGVGAGIGVLGGGVKGVANQEGAGGTIRNAVGSGLWNAGLGSIIGGGIGALEAYFSPEEEREQARRILQRLQESSAPEEPVDTPQEVPEMPPQALPPMPSLSGLPTPTINYNIHNFGPQLLQR